MLYNLSYWYFINFTSCDVSESGEQQPPSSAEVKEGVGYRRQGKPRMRWLDSIKEVTGLCLGVLKEVVQDRKKWRMVVWGKDSEQGTHQCEMNSEGNGRPLLDSNSCLENPLLQCFSNFFQVGTTFISQNVLRTTLLLGLSNSLGLP